jgi:lysophospholipase L1-like esterase
MAQVTAATIDWEVEQRFRNFDFLGSKQDALLAWKTFSPRETDASLVDWVSRLNREGRESPYAQDKGAWREAERDVRHLFDRQLLVPPDHFDVIARITLVAGEGASCTWNTDGTSHVEAPCSASVRLSIPATGARVTVRANSTLVAADEIRPAFKRILGLGDSYASGQGNPDRPTRWHPGFEGRPWEPGRLEETREYARDSADWLSPRCNRSFWSQQHMAALRIASTERHAQIAFVHLACTGAEIIDGLLAPQRMPSGMADACHRKHKNRPKGAGVDVECDVPYSQLAAAVALLCSSQPVGIDPALRQEITSVLKLKHATHQRQWIDDLVRCDGGDLNSVDMVLVSIGGNDIGFAGVIAHALLPVRSRLGSPTDLVVGLTRKEGNVVCPYAGAPGKCSGLSAAQRIRDLPVRFDALNRALHKLLAVSGPKIVLTEYTNPLRGQSGQLCANPTGTNRNQWDALRLALPIGLNPGAWQINLTEGEANGVDRGVVPQLNAALRRAANKHGWRFVPTGAAMERHGWCVGGPRALGPVAEAHRWNAYADVDRRIRTANDSLLTQWGLSASRRDWLSGVFHPNAYGHAAIADAVVRVVADR